MNKTYLFEALSKIDDIDEFDNKIPFTPAPSGTLMESEYFTDAELKELFEEAENKDCIEEARDVDDFITYDDLSEGRHIEDNLPKEVEELFESAEDDELQQKICSCFSSRYGRKNLSKSAICELLNENTRKARIKNAIAHTSHCVNLSEKRIKEILSK